MTEESHTDNSPVVTLSLHCGKAPSGGVYMVLNAVTVHGTRCLGSWNTHGRLFDAGELQDVISAMGVALIDHFTLTSGVQLVLHD